MGLLDDLRKEPSHKPPKPCKMAIVMATLDKDTVAELNRIMASIASLEGQYTASWLSRQLENNGLRVNHSTVNRHAKGTCCCAN